ncbi:hypothetical protein HKX48_008645 [Thoreauomyces humboldtii]|nr:hypothetical protein HKX48_008645 [Thoreauomyces humboldtii]
MISYLPSILRSLQQHASEAFDHTSIMHHDVSYHSPTDDGGHQHFAPDPLDQTDFAATFEALSAHSDGTSPSPLRDVKPMLSASLLDPSPGSLHEELLSPSGHHSHHSQEFDDLPVQSHYSSPNGHQHHPSLDHSQHGDFASHGEDHAFADHHNVLLKSEGGLDHGRFDHDTSNSDSGVQALSDASDVPEHALSDQGLPVHQDNMEPHFQQPAKPSRHDAFPSTYIPGHQNFGSDSSIPAMHGTGPVRPTRSRAQTFHFGSQFTYPSEGSFSNSVYPYPGSSDRTRYAQIPAYDSLPPLTTVPEHSTSISASQNEMYSIPPQVHEDRQMRHYTFPDGTDIHQAFPGNNNGRRSPSNAAHTRQRSISDQMLRPAPLLTDAATLNRRSSVMTYASPNVLTPSGTPTPSDSYDSPHALPMSTFQFNPTPMSADILHSHMGYGSGYLNPAHLSYPHTRRRAPSAPLMPHTYYTPLASPASGSPHGSPVSAFPNGPSSLHLPLHHSHHHHSPLPNDMHSQPLMNPVDEEFKRRILQLKFEEREMAIDFLKEQAKSTGFSVLVRTSRPDYVVIICNCGRRVKHVEGERKRKRKRKTAMTGCEWHIILFRRTIQGYVEFLF